MKKILIHCQNNQVEKEYPIGTSLSDITKDLNVKLKGPIIGVLVNNKLKDLTYEVFNPKTIQFIDNSSTVGMGIYERSLSFLLYAAVKHHYPKAVFKVEHAISNGVYCRVLNKELILTPEDVEKIKERMLELVATDIPIIRKEVETEKAIEIFEKRGLQDKVENLRIRGNLYTSVYYLGDQVNYFYNSLAPSTGLLQTFDLKHYARGMLLMLPKKENPTQIESFVEQPGKFAVLNEFKRWGKILEISDVNDLNRMVINQKVGELIKISEALHEKKVAQIADKIYRMRKKLKLILIAGPSSSGKTTFGKRLAIQLKANGLKPVNLSLDNYFVNRVDTPLDENGEYDFEAVEAIDLKKFNQDLVDLLEGKTVKVPKFSFEKGERFYDGEEMTINRKNILVVEGIHGLNPKLTARIEEEAKFKIYISALTSIAIDKDNRIPGHENRLIRRMIRDYRYRGYSATDTIKRWDSVRRGEDKHILSFLNEADIMFNSALPYELGVLKQYAEPILRQVQRSSPEFSEARRLLKFFSFFIPILADEIPPTSLLREFLGGSTFDY